MSEANRTAHRRIREVTAGVTPNSPAFSELLFTSSAIAYSPESVQDDSISSDRQVLDSQLVGYEVSGEVSHRLRFGALDSVLESALMSQWVNQPQKATTAYTSAAGTHTVASGGAAFLAGHLVLIEGYDTAANNGVKKVASSTGTTVVTGAGGTDEPSPTASTIRVVGFEGGSGVISCGVTPNRLLGTGLNTLGIKVGDWILLGGTAAGNKFSINAANNGWVRVSAVASGSLTLDSVPTGWAADAGTAKTIRIWLGDTLRNGFEDLPDTIEREMIGEDAVSRYRYFRGCRYNLNLEVTAKQLMTVSMSVMGMSASRIEASRHAGATTVASVEGEVFDGSNNVREIRLGGVPLVNPNIPLSFSIGVDNSWRTRDGVGIVGAAGIKAGTCLVTGNVEAYLGDAALVNYLQDQTYFSVSFPTLAKTLGRGYFWDVPRAKFTDGGEEIEGRDTDISPDMEYLGHRTAASPFYTLQVQRFHYLEV
jgi:hypothetical protein